MTNRNRDPPGPIDNRSIIISVPGTSGNSGTAMQTLKTSSDYLQISQDIWQLFHSIYGGGPEVILRPNGVVYVSPVSSRTPNLPALASRLLARTTSWSTPPRPAQGVMTRAKTRSISEEMNQVEDVCT